MNNPMGAPNRARGSLSTERVSGGGAGVEVAPYTARPAAPSASAAHTATSTRRPSELSAMPNTDCVSGQPAAPHVRSYNSIKQNII